MYVDNIILTRNDHEEIERFKGVMAREFEIKDLGPLRYFLGMEVAKSRKGTVVSQRKYTLDLLKEISMLSNKLANIPMDQNKKNEIGTLWIKVDINDKQVSLFFSHTLDQILHLQ